MNNTDHQLGVVFAGAGMVAELHQRALSMSADATLIGVVEPDQERRERRAKEWSCRAYQDYEQALEDPAIDAVFVLSPEATHERLALAAMRSKKAVLVEKPVAEPDAISRLQAEAARQGVVCMPGHNYAYQPEFTQLHRLVRDGSLGTIRAAWITYAIKHPEEVAQHYAGVLQEVMIHHTYLAIALFGPPVSVFAGRMEPAWTHHKQDDQAWMTWNYPQGKSLHLFASFAVDDDTSDSWMFVVKVLGTKGGGSYTWRNTLYHRPLGTLSLAIPAYEDSYFYEQRAFFDAIRGNRDGIVSPLRDAYQAARLIDLAKEADRQRAAVSVPAWEDATFTD